MHVARSTECRAAHQPQPQQHCSRLNFRYYFWRKPNALGGNRTASHILQDLKSNRYALRQLGTDQRLISQAKLVSAGGRLTRGQLNDPSQPIHFFACVKLHLFYLTLHLSNNWFSSVLVFEQVMLTEWNIPGARATCKLAFLVVPPRMGGVVPHGPVFNCLTTTKIKTIWRLCSNFCKYPLLRTC